jgi:glycosyltransferase involved in cell wall biosynthesis
MVSIGYVLGETPSDKHFVNQLISGFPAYFDIAVWSLNDASKQSGRVTTCGKGIQYENRNRLLHRPLFIDQDDSYVPHPSHSPIRNGVEMNMSLFFWYVFRLHRFIRRFNPDIIHFTDASGPIVAFIKCMFPSVPVTITKPTMRIDYGKLDWLYKLYMKYSLKPSSKIFTYTAASGRKLRDVGFTESQLERVPWGVSLPSRRLTQFEKSEIRKRYMCADDQTLVVVADRSIQDGIRALKKRLDVLLDISSVVFVVAIRPTRFRADFKNIQAERIYVESGPGDFYDLLDSADVLFSPSSVGLSVSTSLLPLAWMEAMVRGTPVITESCYGVEDLIENRRSGFTYRNENQLQEIFAELSCRKFLNEVQAGAEDMVKREFHIGDVVNTYEKVWSSLLS